VAHDEQLVHELAQPLQVISLLSDRLRQRPEAVVQRAAEQISQQLGRITHIVRRISAPERTPTDLNTLIREAIDLVVLTHSQCHVAVVLDLAETVVLNIDHVQIEQVLVNLVRNALEAMQTKSHGLLVVRSNLGDGQIEVAVIDNGPGIAPAVMRQLFHPHTTSKASGKGIGLTISQDIVRAHGGRMTVTSSDSGTCFVITLPC
jgi:signal transduction histidine kinase